MQSTQKKLRHELKYFINFHQYLELRQRLRQIMQLDRFALANGEYHVRSLYFDDMVNSALYEKSFGVFRRDKYRIRIYNKNDQPIKLERKSKYGQYINKESAILSREEYGKILRNDLAFLSSSTQPLQREFYFDAINRVLRPKVIVDYEREAYLSGISEVRVTFDKMVRAGMNTNDIFDPDVVTFNAFPQPLMIMEIKYNQFIPEMIHKALQIRSHERSAISKYVACRVVKNNI